MKLFNIVNFFYYIFLISSNINAMQADKDSDAFLKALIAGDFANVSEFLINGFDVNSEFNVTIWDRNYRKITPLGIAIRCLHFKIVKLLLMHKCIDINKSYFENVSHETPLMSSILSNFEEVFNILISHPQQKYFEIAIIASSNQPNIKYLEKLIDLGISPNVTSEIFNLGTPLTYAVIYKRVEHVKFLYEKGADLNFVNKEGKTPLDFCFFEFSPRIKRNNSEEIKIAQFLISHGAISGEYLKNKKDIKKELSKILPSEFDDNLLNLTTNYCM